MIETLHTQKYVKSKEASWVVFIHGAGGSISTWKRQIDFFKKEFNVLLLDLRDHGR